MINIKSNLSLKEKYEAQQAAQTAKNPALHGRFDFSFAFLFFIIFILSFHFLVISFSLLWSFHINFMLLRQLVSQKACFMASLTPNSCCHFHFDF